MYLNFLKTVPLKVSPAYKDATESCIFRECGHKPVPLGEHEAAFWGLLCGDLGSALSGRGLVFLNDPQKPVKALSGLLCC